MTERKAVYYGQVKLIPGIVCDGYVLNDETAVMSERGTADLLGMKHSSLQTMAVNGLPKSLEAFVDKGLTMAVNGLPKSLEPFMDNGLTMRGNFVEVATRNSPYYGRKIVVYDSSTLESLIRTYAAAFINDGLRQNQIHIGKRAVALLISLVRTALDAAIKEACGFTPDIQKTAQQHYVDAVELLKEFGFKGSIDNNRLATKKEIATFLKIPTSTLSSFLRNHRDEIQPVSLDQATRRAIGSKASQLNGYQLSDVAKISFAMDTETGIELKSRMFGQVGIFATPTTKDEIQWRQIFAKIFAELGLHYNYPIGKYRVDFFVAALGLCLECNGYEHRYYNQQEEAKREQAISKKYGLVRFHHKIGLETLFNGILQAKPGKIIKLYDLHQPVQVETVQVNG